MVDHEKAMFLLKITKHGFFYLNLYEKMIKNINFTIYDKR